MTVGELVKFLSDCDDECQVCLLRCSNDNPLSEDIGIEKAIAIDDSKDDTYIVLIPN